ncbi:MULTISPECIES: family 43 glycosylhydrolase [Streptomyces]|uniref:Family 43 glycosylhydrolase n=1 Tax=Streptomyces caniscabiei TaxID=2746961 RepID=A0ABU4MWS2_9ACTN|nr:MULTISPECIES: family 43 glycosylhydrolase [Streptomyces]MBE4740712.1 family 43 glycosylhydrolase [Streptomyces caniscabiei]MBE4759390.1 family 43 glycosylhydrolase [Streptomyces caniscabiei]MBE4774482.1 family 43 glycosylhydrolase [Streptomyces caniscabiei]MBE4788844.1 family 43 glycosylhydrolase [Streptomyces caniscabiei]MBE4798033.1 family 43 glycosylhydrolase [Streptomyces caniscabiei]
MFPTRARRWSTPRRSLLLAVALLALFASLLSVQTVHTAQSAAAADGKPYTNPVKSQKGADPWLEYYNGNYYLVTTSFTGELTMRKSPTLAGLSTAPSVQVWSDSTSTRNWNMWAPEIHFFDGKWYLYYSAGPRASACCDDQRTYVLESAGSDPMGPYTFKNQLAGSNLNPGGWLIDVSVLKHDNKLYLAGSGSVGGSKQSLVIAPLSNPYTLASTTFTVISSPTLSWETQSGEVNEGPEPLYRNGRTFLIYSASACWGPDYKLGQLELTGSDPLLASSWTKKQTPVFQRNDANGVYAPGHNGFFTSPDGTENWIVYHANDAASDGCDNGRTTRAQKFTWNADGTPNFGSPVALGSTIAGPSGETATTPTAYTIVNRNSGKCLDVTGGGTADGTNIAQWTCNGGANQKWRIEDRADDTSRLVNVATGKVADVTDCASADGADIRQWSWLNNNCQKFRMVYLGGDYVRIVNAATGKVMDVADCGTANGTDVRQWSWLNNNCQQWRLVPTTA